MVAFNERLYVLGGYDGQEFLHSTEVFDPGANCWLEGPRMNVRRARVAACVSGTSLYAIGGYNGYDNISSMEVLQLEPGWTPGRAVGEAAAAEPAEDDDAQPSEAAPTWRMAPSMKWHEGGVGVGVVPVSPRKLCGLDDVQHKPRQAVAEDLTGD